MRVNLHYSVCFQVKNNQIAAQLQWVKLWYLPLSISSVTQWMIRKPYGEEVSNGQDILTIGNFEIPSRAYVGRFNFKGVDQQKRVGELSGG